MGNVGKQAQAIREALGNEFVAALDGARHALEQAAWGRETTGDLADDFYRWASDGQDAGGAVGTDARGENWGEFEAWLDCKAKTNMEHTEPEPELELGE